MKSYWGTRLWIRISSLFGIIMVVFMLGGYFYLINQYNNGVRNKSLDSIIIKNANDLVSGPGILMLFLIWSTVKTLVCNIGLIKFAGEEDSVFLANKWTLIVLSLSIGGFFAPWSMSRLPNVNVKATRNARVTIVKYMGFAWALSGLLTSIIFVVLKTKLTGSFTGNSSKYFTLIISINALLFVVNFIAFLIFNIKPAANILNAKEPGYKKYEMITTMYVFVITLQLIVLIISACLRTILDFLKAAEGQDAFERIFNVINAIFSLVYTIYLIKIITSTIKGLWRKEDYMVEIPIYNKLDAYNKNKGIK